MRLTSLALPLPFRHSVLSRARCLVRHSPSSFFLSSLECCRLITADLKEQLARQNGGSIPSSAPPQQQQSFVSQPTSHAYPTASTSAFTLDHQHHRDPLALLAESSSLAMPTQQQQQQQSLPFFSTGANAATSAAPTSSFAMPSLATQAHDVPVASTPQYWAAATTPTQSSSTSAPQPAASTFAAAFDFSQFDGLGSLSWDGPVDLTLSGYPSDLPSPSLLRRLVDVYFSKPHLATGLINEARFRASMTYPPDDPRAPIPCLLHAMIATAAMMVAEDSFFASESYRYWDLDGSGTSLCDYHAVRAESLLNPSLKQGRQLLQIVQASVLCCFCAYTSARFADIWLLSAQSSRLAICVGLNQIRLPGMAGGAGSYASPAGATPDSASGGGWTPHSALPKKRQTTSRLKDKSMLPPTTDPDELAERSSVFYFVFGQDRMTSAATGWAPVLSEEDITTLLPHPPGAPDTVSSLYCPPSTPLTSSSLPERRPPRLASLHSQSLLLLRQPAAPRPQPPALLQSIRPPWSRYEVLTARAGAGRERVSSVTWAGLARDVSHALPISPTPPTYCFPAPAAPPTRILNAPSRTSACPSRANSSTRTTPLQPSKTSSSSSSPSSTSVPSSCTSRSASRPARRRRMIASRSVSRRLRRSCRACTSWRVSRAISRSLRRSSELTRAFGRLFVRGGLAVQLPELDVGCRWSCVFLPSHWLGREQANPVLAQAPSSAPSPSPLAAAT